MATKFIANKLHLIEVRILEGKIKSPFEFKVTNVEEFPTDFNLSISYNAEHNMVLCNFSVEVKTQSSPKPEKEAKGKFKFAFIYMVDNLEELIEVDESEAVEFDRGLKNAVASITYSTSRGMLLTRFQGTVFAKFIMPVINPNSLFE